MSTTRRPLGTGPHPATPPAPPSAARRARLAAELAEPTTATDTPVKPTTASGRRALGSGAEAAEH